MTVLVNIRAKLSSDIGDGRKAEHRCQHRGNGFCCVDNLMCHYEELQQANQTFPLNEALAPMGIHGHLNDT